MTTELQYGDPQKWEPFPGAPRFFRRVWNPPNAGQMTTTEFAGREVPCFTPGVPDGGLAIYGFSARSPYPEDQEAENRAFLNGMFPSICFSEAELSGEYGFTPLSDSVAISEDEFLLAKSRGFV